MLPDVRACFRFQDFCPKGWRKAQEPFGPHWVTRAKRFHRLIGRYKMHGINLPQDILNRFERRWAARMSQRIFHSRAQEVQSPQAIGEGLADPPDAVDRKECPSN